MAKFIFRVSTGFVGADIQETVEIPDEELEGMDSIEKEKFIQDHHYKWWLQENVEMDFYEDDDE